MADAEPAPLLEIGRVVKPHGLACEVVVQLFTNRLERMASGSSLRCERAPGQVLEVVAARPHQGRYLVRFAGVSGIDAAESLRGALLEATALADPDAMFVHDLVGCELADTTGTRRGIVVAVEANPASDILVLDSGHLVPLRFVVERSHRALVVDAPDGLFD
jgi:16S rRNA processing protein RimM